MTLINWTNLTIGCTTAQRRSIYRLWSKRLVKHLSVAEADILIKLLLKARKKDFGGTLPPAAE
ncbi:MAG TPA: hypothetical protein VG326_12210 [Tepidisphaeraceae bacterium]|jgi:hypothetical protein|nr:hypothetical protein [Tepidisphaeraceae bacterium]